MERVTHAEISYYCYLPDGTILDSSCFKNVFRSVLSDLKYDLHDKLYYDYRCATIYYGVYKHWSDNHFSYESLRQVCFLYVSVIDKKIHVSIQRY